MAWDYIYCIVLYYVFYVLTFFLQAEYVKMNFQLKLVIVMEMLYVFCKVGTEFLNII